MLGRSATFMTAVLAGIATAMATAAQKSPEPLSVANLFAVGVSAAIVLPLALLFRSWFRRALARWLPLPPHRHE